MYRFLAPLTPDDVEAIAALAYVEMLEAGLRRVAEFHYLHHQPGGAPYADLAEMAARIAAAAARDRDRPDAAAGALRQGGSGGVPLAGGAAALRLRPRRSSCGCATARRPSGCRPDAALGVAPHSLRAVAPEALAARS